jgi:hypothetical protein
MPSSYTPLLRLTLPADGELVGTWGQTVNNGITSLEEAAIAGTASVALADADYVMTIANGAADVARNAVVRFTGALTAQRNITVPSSSKLYFIRNDTTGGFGLNVKTAAGTGIVVPAGQAMLLYCNGVDVLVAITALAAGGGINGTPDLILKASGVERMRITAAGLVGIGMVPVFPLDIAGPDNSGIRYNAPGGAQMVVGAGPSGTSGFVGTTSAHPLLFNTSGTERMRIDAAGKVGIGIAPPAGVGGYTNYLTLGGPGAVNPSIMLSNNGAGGALWQIGAAGNTGGWLSFYDARGGAERMRLTADGNVGIGGTPPVYGLDVRALMVGGPGVNQGVYDINVNGVRTAFFTAVTGRSILGTNGATSLDFYTNNTARASIDDSGNLLVGATSGSTHTISKGGGQGVVALSLPNIASFAGGDGVAGNVAACCMNISRPNTTTRSINAAGSVNVNGADYAEYEPTRSQSFAKGDVVGFDADGVLTQDFHASLRFGIKSSDPGYVGGDAWGAGLEGDALEAARQSVDRVAYSGKVPVNVWDAVSGGYIVAEAGLDGFIEAVFVADVDFEQYKRAVGRVNRILDDGRAEVAVIIH